MAFGKWCVVFACCLIFPGMVQAQEIEIELQMPGSMFGPGSLFSVDLAVENTGNAYSDAQLFVALAVGTSDFWFYPSWAQFPPNIDWENIFVPAYASDQWVILPAFSWPHGAGSFESAMFLAAIVHDGELVSNLAETYFGWTDAPPAFEVYIPPGTYTRGSPEDEPCRYFTEGPQHQVTLTRGFHMMTTEVTRQMWADLKAVQPTLPNDPSDTTYSPTMEHPVQYNTWYEAVLFANLMSLRDGYTRCYYKDAGFTTPVDASNYTSGSFYCNFNANGYRLPTEAEWEYAARAGTRGPFSAHEPNYTSGNCSTCSPSPPLNVLDSIAWWCGNSDIGSGRMAHPVDTKLPNPWGLYDMHGNVWEWCWDWYGSYPSGPVTDPTGPLTGSYRVVRSGSWYYFARRCRSALRYYGVPDDCNHNQGFRLLRTATGTQPTPTPTPPPAPTGYVYIPPGTCTLGSPSGEPCRVSDETQHQVTLTRGFYMMTTEVTRQMWADLKAAQPTLPNDPSDKSVSRTLNHPVQYNTWYEAVLFANLMSLRDGYTQCYYKDSGFTTPVDASNYTSGSFYCNFNATGYRLPTEAEWEYACRAGTTGPFSCSEPDYNSGNCSSCTAGTHPTLEQYCVYCANDPGGTMIVGSKLANPWGLVDMHGNVREWCWDWYGSYPSGSVTDPTGPSSGSGRGGRGGSWINYARSCRSAHRYYYHPAYRHHFQGFRLLRSTN